MLKAPQLEDALKAQEREGKRIGDILVARGYVSEVQLTQMLSNQLSVPWVSLYHVDFSRHLLNFVPRELAEMHCLVPVYLRNVRKQGDTLYVAMDDPTNEDALKAVRSISGLPVKPMVTSPSDIRHAIRVYYGGGGIAVTTETGEGTAGSEGTKKSAGKAPPPPPPAPASAKSPKAPVLPARTRSRKSSVVSPKVRMVSMTLLDGTTVSLPTPGQKIAAEQHSEESLTARDLIAALRAKSHGNDVTEVIGEAQWENMFAALLSLLMKKHLIADWEFVEEWKKSGT
ncbi:MAG: hypothetical protein IPK60_25265 [Sandaracinaceae bacterium]|nr:hypothetical protein [Sandaracinaceae bacterium]